MDNLATMILKVEKLSFFMGIFMQKKGEYI